MSSRASVNVKSNVDSDANCPNERFDYSSVSPSLAKFLKGQAERIQHQCVTSIIQIGKSLVEAKRHLSHGAFLRWVQYEVHLPVRTAQAYMRVASWASNKRATVAHLTPTVLYLLSAPSTPEDFSAEILAQVEAGEPIAPSALRKALKVRRMQERAGGQNDLEAVLMSGVGRSDSIGSETCRGSSELTEFVEMLSTRLSAMEFERVQQIMTSTTVLNDPELPNKLRRAFENPPPFLRTAANVELIELVPRM
ncbi:DUF3102 domain-containing protein [Bradyrhizobium ontarionense]|uniref:DUF3102 domain-containing protein n=1 Tax=Bradyrhizobium ontarionense TaxID=2898149 RepID=A0ABY3RCL1_9BRAD|nr:DUF3102 domain-containing protein [Bradyrhizobium sp. A19]UFZ04956.1 DUF3102 domain-containing protein [Bradyrhizobium sp. A19]